MNEQETLDYARIAQAIGYIRENFKRQPGLDEIAREVALSTAHFQRMFTEWAGVSPKKFLQYTSIEYAKKILDETHASLFDTAEEAAQTEEKTVLPAPHVPRGGQRLHSDFPRDDAQGVLGPQCLDCAPLLQELIRRELADCREYQLFSKVPS
mgnify:CR=1 FL=1